MKTGIELIAQERDEQINKHGWTPIMDDHQRKSQLAIAAAAVLDLDDNVHDVAEPHSPWYTWPWPSDIHVLDKISRKDRVGQLAVAGALIAAEIDRLQRQNPTQE